MGFIGSWLGLGNSQPRPAPNTPAPASGATAAAPPPPPPPVVPPSHTDGFDRRPVQGPIIDTTVQMANGPHGVNHTTNNLPSASGRITPEQWRDPSQIVARLTQNPAAGANGVSHATCAASNMVGAALMASPEHAARLMENVAFQSNNLSNADKTQLFDIAARVRNHTATFEDLNAAQALVYKAGNTTQPAINAVTEVQGNPAEMARLNPTEQQFLNGASSMQASPQNLAELGRVLTKATGHTTTVQQTDGFFTATVTHPETDTSGMYDREIGDLAAKTGFPSSQRRINNGEFLDDMVKTLQPGQSMIVRVAGEGGLQDINNDHFVTVGRRTDGTYFLYNPDPSRGDATLVTSRPGSDGKPSADFNRAVRSYADRSFSEQTDAGTWRMPQVTTINYN